MLNRLFISSLTALLCVTIASAQDHSVEVIENAAEAEGVSDEITKLISDRGYRVKRGSSRTVCEIWLCKELAVDASFKPSVERLYPFQEGQLIGLLHFSRRGSDFRDQSISSGWYTLRFGLQPIDGNHEGTSPTRDFLLLVDAEQDDLPENWKPDDLNEASAEAAGATHPGMLCLQRPGDGTEMTLTHDEANDWWILHVIAKGVDEGASKQIPIDLVVVGHAAE